MPDPRHHCAIRLAAIVAALAASARCPAETEPPAVVAERLFREGREAVKRGDYAVACPKFAESQRLDPANGTLLNLALCEEGWGHAADARGHLREVLAVPDLDDKRRQIAVAHANALEAPAPSSDRTPEPRAPDRPPVAPAAATSAEHTEPRDGSDSPRVAAYFLGGVGLLSLTTCVVTGILVIERADTVEAHCPNKLCDAEGLAAASSGRTLSAVSTAAFGAGMVLTGLSTYFLLQPGASNRSSAVVVRGTRGGVVATLVRTF